MELQCKKSLLALETYPMTRCAFNTALLHKQDEEHFASLAGSQVARLRFLVCTVSDAFRVARAYRQQ